MWPDRRLIELFKIEFPIVQAPVAGAMDWELAAAAADAGALGSLPCAMLNADQIREQMAKIRARTKKPILLPCAPGAQQRARSALARKAGALLPGARNRSRRAGPFKQPHGVRFCDVRCGGGDAT